MPRNVLQSSVLSAGSSIIFQIMCRLVTFGINAYIVRSIGREVLGIMNVRLLLLESTLLFLSREAINRAALSATSQRRDKCSWAQLVNQIWLTIPICILMCIPSVFVWLHWFAPVEDHFKEQYRFACYAVSISCIVELTAEAPVFVSQVFCFIKLKIVLNTLHIFVRSLIFLWIVTRDGNLAIKAFGIAQLASAITIVVGHYSFFYFYIRLLNEFRLRKNIEMKINILKEIELKSELFENMDDFPFEKLTQMLPGVLENKECIFNSELQTLTMSFVKQGFLKQILTEGEKYVMSISPVLGFSEQATYDVVNNLGSLTARFIFRPIEENSYFFFTQTISRDVDLNKQERNQIINAGNVLSSLSSTVCSIGLLVLTFGQSYAHPVLLIYGGADFVSGGLPERLLQMHCIAILLMAVNGITEGYMFATNTSKEIDTYNYLMAVFSVSFLFLSYMLTSCFGPIGFILANCINMLCRIFYSTRFIRKQYQPIGINPLNGLYPGKIYFTALVFFGLLCKFSLIHSSSILSHCVFGFFCVLICVTAWGVENRKLVEMAWKYSSNKKKD